MPKDMFGIQIKEGQNVVVQLGNLMVTGTVAKIQEGKLVEAKHLAPGQPPTGQVIIMIPYTMPYLDTGNPQLRGIIVTQGQPEYKVTPFSTDDKLN